MKNNKLSNHIKRAQDLLRSVKPTDADAEEILGKLTAAWKEIARAAKCVKLNQQVLQEGK